MEEKYAKAAKIFKALSDPKRVKILAMLANDGEMCACAILENFQISQPTLSHDLKLLTDVGVINSRREGQRVMYSINHDVLQKVQTWLKKILQAG